jgi:hypothetical protein
MKAGDTPVYYSPAERLGNGTPLQRFTALGTAADNEIWQADEGDPKPFRRRVHYEDTTPADVENVEGLLQQTASRNWGYQLRRGLIPLEQADVEILRSRMT